MCHFRKHTVVENILFLAFFRGANCFADLQKTVALLNGKCTTRHTLLVYLCTHTCSVWGPELNVSSLQLECYASVMLVSASFICCLHLKSRNSWTNDLLLSSAVNKTEVVCGWSYTKLSVSTFACTTENHLLWEINVLVFMHCVSIWFTLRFPPS